MWKLQVRCSCTVRSRPLSRLKTSSRSALKIHSFETAERPKKPPNRSKRCCPGGLDMAISCAGPSITNPRCFGLAVPCGGLRSTYRLGSTYRLASSALRSASIDSRVFALLSVSSACFGAAAPLPLALSAVVVPWPLELALAFPLVCAKQVATFQRADRAR